MNFRLILAHFPQMRNAHFGMQNLDLFRAPHAEISEKSSEEAFRTLIFNPPPFAFSAVDDQDSASCTLDSSVFGI